MRPEQQRVKQLLTEAITLLCRNSLQFKEDVTVEGLLGITLDKSDIFLVSINETVQQTLRESAAEVRAEKRNVDHNSDDGHTPKKRRRRRGSREGSSSPPLSPVVQTESQPDDEEPSDRVNVKVEKSSDESCHGPQDGRKFNPAHDSTSEPPPDNKALIQKQQDHSHSEATPISGDSGGEVQVKQEVPEEEEDCFLIDSDSQDASDTSHSLPLDSSSIGSHSWASPGGDQPAFNLSELDMISAASFQQQFGNIGMGGANNMSWDPSQLQGQPSTSGTQDGSQRIGSGIHGTQSPQGSHSSASNLSCHICGKQFTTIRGLKFHIDRHTGRGKFKCRYCDKTFNMWNHLDGHENRHTNSQPYRCAKCNKCYFYKNTKISHEKHCMGIASKPIYAHVQSKPN